MQSKNIATYTLMPQSITYVVNWCQICLLTCFSSTSTISLCFYICSGLLVLFCWNDRTTFQTITMAKTPKSSELSLMNMEIMFLNIANKASQLIWYKSHQYLCCTSTLYSNQFMIKGNYSTSKYCGWKVIILNIIEHNMENINSLTYVTPMSL